MTDKEIKAKLVDDVLEALEADVVWGSQDFVKTASSEEISAVFDMDGASAEETRRAMQLYGDLLTHIKNFVGADGEQ